MAEHPIKWTSPSPLWPLATTVSAAAPGFVQPAILRFAKDSFMTDFMSMLATDPAQLPGLIATPETWRGPLTSAPTPPPPPKFIQNLNAARATAARRLQVSFKSLVQPATAPAAIPISPLIDLSNSSSAPPVLKLFQPAHQRFYLVTACLVCGIPGLPDRRIDSGKNEKATFVIRRLQRKVATDTGALTPQNSYEFAYITGGPGGRDGWQQVNSEASPSAAVILPNEDRLPLFSTNFLEADGRTRRLYAGLVPVGKREAYLAAQGLTTGGAPADGQSPSPNTALKILLRTILGEPWKNLINAAITFVTSATDPGSGASNPALPLAGAVRAKIQTASWYILLDFANYLVKYLPRVWNTMAGSPAPADISQTEKDLLTALGAAVIPDALKKDLPKGMGYPNPPTVLTKMSEALLAVIDPDTQKGLEGATRGFQPYAQPYSAPTFVDGWPTFLFPLADPCISTGSTNAPVPPNSNAVVPPPMPPPLPSTITSADITSDDFSPEEPLPSVIPAPVPAGPGTAADIVALLTEILPLVDEFVALVVRALPANDPQAQPAVPVAAGKVFSVLNGTFLIRCIFDRPNCAPFDPPIVSDPSVPFKLAGFFDPDAPARPIRIALPIDTSPAGLRKFDKNTAFVMSDILCGQVRRAKGLGFVDLVLSVLPWPFHKDLDVPDTGPCTGDKGLALGMICSFSLPIITICALIMLLIMVTLLDIIFSWLPFFVICFPLPGFSGKDNEE
ncbi:MAG TPA: hypothetical protein VG326_21345 [Tepidisphaeraceae bacterium]|jgi:hypothetical protein|nr:hypothetical protein [Tepidisphaeraceae bacterium]